MSESSLFQYLESYDIVSLFISGTELPYRTLDDILNIPPRFMPKGDINGYRNDAMKSILFYVHQNNDTNKFLNYWLSLPMLHDKIKYIMYGKDTNNDNFIESISNLHYRSTDDPFDDGEILVIDEHNVQFIYKALINKLLKDINNELLFSGIKLTRVNKNFIISKYSSDLSNYLIDKSNSTYIHDLISEAKLSLKNHDFDSVITKSRTIIEATYKKMLKDNNIPFKENGKIGQYRDLVTSYLNMKPNKNWDKRISNFINGINKIVDSINDMRNNDSDAHAKSDMINIHKAEAELIFNVSVSISNYLLMVNRRHMK